MLSRVARQLDVGLESLRTWVKQADVASSGADPDEQAELAELRREIKELRQANEIREPPPLRGAELDRRAR